MKLARRQGYSSSPLPRPNPPRKFGYYTTTDADHRAESRLNAAMADQSQIDPRLFASASTVPPRTQLYSTSAPQQNTGHPYYLPSPTAQHHTQSHPHHHQSQTPQLSQPAPLANILDPALEQTSPAGPEHDHDDDEDGDDGDHDGYVMQTNINACAPADSPSSAHGTPGSGKSPADLKRPRACDSCRGLKVRCDQERPDVSCRRCAKAGRACITTPPTRKRQKKADSRVAELERKIDALTATLHAQKAGAQDIGHHGGMPQHEAGTNAIQMPPDNAYRLGSLSHEWPNSAPTNRYPDIPPGYGPAQNIQRGPESKRRKLETTHAVSRRVAIYLAKANSPDDSGRYGCHSS